MPSAPLGGGRAGGHNTARNEAARAGKPTSHKATATRASEQARSLRRAVAHHVGLRRDFVGASQGGSAGPSPPGCAEAGIDGGVPVRPFVAAKPVCALSGVVPRLVLVLLERDVVLKFLTPHLQMR